MKQSWHNEFPIDMADTGRKVSRFPPWRKRTLYAYTEDPDRPMTFRFSRDGFVRPAPHLETDMGSIPPLAQLAIPKDLHNPSFILHDSGCHEHGLYFSGTLYGVYTFAPMTSRRVHALLRQCLVAAGHKYRARIVWAAVRAFGPRWHGLSAPAS